MDPYRIRRAILSGKRRLIIAAVLGLGLGYFVAKFVLISPYQTVAILKYEGDLDVPGLPPTIDALGPAARAVHHQAVLRRVREESGFRGSLTALAAGIKYQISLMSQTMSITVGSRSADGAAKHVRLVTDVFMDYHKERQSDRLEGELARVKKRIAAATEEVELARRRSREFRDLHGISDLSTEQQSSVRDAARLRADSELAIAEIRALEAEVASMEAQLEATPKTALVSGTESPERAAYNRLRQELASARATLSEDHPRVQSLSRQVAQLRGQVGAPGLGSDAVFGANATYQSIEARLRSSKSRLAAAQARYRGLVEVAEKTSDRVESFSDVEGEAAELLADVKVNETLLNNLRRTEAAIEDALSDPPSGFVVLDPGAVPEYPERNKMKIVVFGGVPMFSVGLALLLLLRREFRGWTPITPAEVAYWGDGPVLGATSWPDDPRGFEELVAGLDDLVPAASGNVLLIGGSEAEASLALELADRLRNDWALVRSPGVRSDAPEPTITVPPASGPYPVGGSQSVALARIPAAPEREGTDIIATPHGLELEAWEGPLDGQALRRAARLADRVVVLVRSGASSISRLHYTRQRIGRDHGVGFIVLGLQPELSFLPDRVGDVAAFWGLSNREA